MHKQMPDSAPGVDGLPNRFLQTLGSPFVDIITVLIEACWELRYHPRRFKATRIIALRKSNKRDYRLFNIWRFIALLNTVGKLIETAAAKRLRDAAEAYILFPNSQIQARPGRSTETILELFTEQVHTA